MLVRRDLGDDFVMFCKEVVVLCLGVGGLLIPSNYARKQNPTHHRREGDGFHC